MATLTLTLACTQSDRTRPILDGQITVPGCDLVMLPGEPEDIFRRAIQDRAFDICELSMGSHITATARGSAHYIGIPVFPSRAFRHSAIYVRTDRGIRTPQDLRGKTVGLPDYQQTAGMWVRGILADQHGVSSSDVRWRVVGARTALELPPGLDVVPLPAGSDLSDLLARGELDAVMTPRPPACFLDRSAPVDRLFPDYREAEIAYHRATGFFPIMHCLTLRRELAASHPWLPLELFRAFARAKSTALAELSLINVLRVSLPWIAVQYQETRAVMGPNVWRYGLGPNHHELSAMTRYAATDGLATRRVPPEELFHPSTHEAADPDD